MSTPAAPDPEYQAIIIAMATTGTLPYDMPGRDQVIALPITINRLIDIAKLYNELIHPTE